MSLDLNERAQQILKALIETYIRDGEPVGSKTLVAESGLKLSSATVRSVFADLEAQGLIVSPHTSAGRVPTAKGYRFFVDSCITMAPPADWDLLSLHELLGLSSDQVYPKERLIDRASALLSEMTRCAVVVSYPKTQQVILRHLEFLPLSDNRMLVILVVNDHEVENRVFQTAKGYSRSELKQAAAYLNAHFAGQDLMHVHADLIQSLSQDLHELTGALELMQQGLSAAKELVHSKTRPKEEFMLFGQAHLLPLAESQGVASISALYQAFSEKKQILNLLESCLSAQGVKIFIGEESGYEPLNACSLIASHYGDQNGVLGVLGVIGPKRLPYEKVIPVVEMTARCLSSALYSED